MDEHYWRKKSGQIPAFGNWEYANQLPITQYFECARQAVAGGLLRHSNYSSGEHDLYAAGRGDILNGAVDSREPPLRTTAFAAPKTSRRTISDKRCPQVKEQKKEVKKKKKIRDVTEQPRKQSLSQMPYLHNRTTTPAIANSTAAVQHHNNRRQPNGTAAAIKAVDDDLYKIPPELLRTTRRRNTSRQVFGTTSRSKGLDFSQDA